MSGIVSGSAQATDHGEIERAVSSIVAWSTRNDIQQETMRRARCDLPRKQVWLLGRLDRNGPARLSHLAHALGVDKSNLTPQAQRLERDGLIVREADPADHRAALLRVTPAGRRLLRRLHVTRQATFAELLAGWTPHQRARVAKALTLLADALVPPVDR